MLLMVFIFAVINVLGAIILGFLPQIPQMPTAFTNSIDYVLDIIFSHVGLLDLFFPVNVVLPLLALSVIVVNFNRIWSVVDWILCHIPVFGTNK